MCEEKARPSSESNATVVVDLSNIWGYPVYAIHDPSISKSEPQELIISAGSSAMALIKEPFRCAHANSLERH